MAELRYSSSRGGAPAVTLSEAIRAGSGARRRTVRARRGCPKSMSARSPARAAARHRAKCARPDSSRAIGWSPCSARSRRAALRFSGADHRRSRNVRIRCSCSSSFTARPRPSRISARAFSPRRSSACRSPSEPPMTILVATSGDTGGAVAAAFHRRPWVRVVILYPKGLVSDAPGATAHLLGRERARPAHRRHIRRLPASGEGGLRRSPTCARGIISAPRTASTSAVCCRRWSITWPRASRSSGARARAPATSFRRAISATPSPPCGPARIGFPIGRIVLAHNANRTVPDFLRDGEWRPRPSIHDARLGDGRRQSQQHGARARALSDFRRR